MIRKLAFVLLVLIIAPSMLAAGEVSYGSNDAAGSYLETDGIKLYYEKYGSGDPVLLIHGNGQSIADMHNQIAHFSKDNQVIVVDTRGHGKSGLGDGQLTYVQMAADYNALLNHLDVSDANIIGWSDGGIITLLLAIHYPDKVGKFATMGANLRPDDSAIDPEVGPILAPLNVMVDEMIASKDTSTDWKLQRQLLDLLTSQPNISLKSVQSIQAPGLIIAGDKDIIRGQHSLQIFENLPNAHLAIMPGQTHWAPVNDPQGFNRLVETFFDTPFTRPSSIDILKAEMGGAEE